MMDQLRKLPAVQKLIAQYDQLPSRDQKALQVLAVAMAIVLLFLLVWRPVTGFHQSAVADREHAENLLAWMESNRPRLQGLAAAGQPGTTSSSITDSRMLMSTVTRSAGEAGLSLQRFEPSGEQAIRVWMERVPFNAVAAWLEQLNSQHGIVIDQVAMDRSDTPGIVSVRLTLQI
ncbi:MAG: type II secretion system protein M [Marinobacter sp.]|nr:type II secretion system protein M [Marinobacter sp.]